MKKRDTILFTPSFLPKCHHPPLPLQNHFLFSPRRPSAQNPQAEPLIKTQKETQSHKRHTKSKQKKAIPTPPLTKVQSKPLKKTIQNNPSNPTN